MSKIRRIFPIFFVIEEYKNLRRTFIIDIFLMYFITKNGPKFWTSNLNPSKSREHFYGRFHRPLALLIHHWTLLSSVVQVRSLYAISTKTLHHRCLKKLKSDLLSPDSFFSFLMLVWPSRGCLPNFWYVWNRALLNTT